MAYPCPLLFLVLVHFFMLLTIGIAKVPAVVVFGDSSVDAGNNNQIPTILKSNFKPYGRDFRGGQPTGRFSDGRIPPDFISEAFGLRPIVPAYLDPMYNISDFSVGVCFASAGTGYDNATSHILSVIPLWKELEYYKEYQKKLRAYIGDKKANTIITEALYLLSLGTNDFLENYYTFPGRSLQYNIEQYQDFLIGIVENFIRELYLLGARKISLGGLLPMGCLPLERTTNFLSGHRDGCVKRYNIVAMNFNEKLDGLVKRLNKELHGIILVFANPYYIFWHIVRKPSMYGFKVAAKACCGTGMFEMSYLCNQYNPFTCTDANKYVFWDSFHPTEKTNRIVSDYLVKHVLNVFF